MKRFLPALGILVAIVAFAALVQRFSFEKAADMEWRALPGGGEIALYGVTIGTTHGMDFPRKRLSQRLREAAKQRSLRPLWKKPGHCYLGSTTPSFAVWFAFRECSSFPLWQGNSQLILPDGQIYSTYMNGGGGGGSGLVHTHFDVIPFTAEKLVFAATIKGQRYDWEVPNPSYNPAGTTAGISGLPLTQSVEGYDVTLQDLALSYSEHPPTYWKAKPVITVSREGKDVSKWFDITSRNPELGLLSAPTWRIETTLSRTSAYPFAPAEVEWLGRYDLSRLAALKPAEYELFPVSETAKRRGVFIAGLFGPGQYDFKKTEVVNPRELPNPQPSRLPSMFNPDAGTTEVSLGKPSLIIASAYGGIPVFHTEADEQVKVEWQGSLNSDYGVKFFEDPSETLRVGVADRKEPATNSRPISFIVRPPRIPDGLDPRTGERLEPANRP